MSGATRAIPRQKEVEYQAARYRVTEQPHFIGGRLVPVGAIVQLPEGVRAGKYLVEVGVDGEPIDKKPAKAEKEEKTQPAK